mmetsp:Transcript_79697/g.231350  ORF Transcript_79697/g.231350 Transcript_79697/m.231350 type:complete len:202 (-) Transcript_79697:1379-1984(-)
MTSSRTRSSAERSLMNVDDMAKVFKASSMAGRTALYFPRFTTGTLRPMMCTKANLVRFSRPTPKPSRTRANVTRSSCSLAHARSSSTEPAPQPNNGSPLASGPKSTQFHRPPSEILFSASLPETFISQVTGLSWLLLCLLACLGLLPAWPACAPSVFHAAEAVSMGPVLDVFASPWDDPFLERRLTCRPTANGLESPPVGS